MLKEYVRNVLVVSGLCCSACFHGGKLQVFYLMLHMFHTYVASVCSKCFIRFIRMLRSNVSCCTCFILFGVNGTGSDGGTARAPENGPRRAGDRRSGHDEGGVRVRDEVGSFESRRTWCAVGGCEATRLDTWALRQGGCACGVGIKISISARGPAAWASTLESHSELAARRGTAVELADRAVVAAFCSGFVIWFRDEKSQSQSR